MNTSFMKTFCDVVDTGSFSRAAEVNGISQSAVSQQVASLERDLATRLLSRDGGFATPTDAGEAFYRAAREVLQRWDQMIAEVRSAEDAVRGTLRVGTIYSVGFYLLDPYVRKFLRAHPEVNLDVEYTRWNRITAAVLHGEMDLGFVAFPEKRPSIEAIPFATEEMVMVCAPSHRLAGRKQVAPAELRGERMVGFEANVPTRRHIDRVLRRFRVPVDVRMEFDNTETLKRAVEVGAGLSILPAGTVAREVAAGHLCSARFTDPPKWVRKIGIIRRRGKAHSRAERMFLGVLRSPV